MYSHRKEICIVSFKVDGLVTHRIDLIHHGRVDVDGQVFVIPLIAVWSGFVRIAGVLLRGGAVDRHDFVACFPDGGTVQEISHSGAFIRYHVETYPIPSLLQFDCLHIIELIDQDDRVAGAAHDGILLKGEQCIF